MNWRLSILLLWIVLYSSCKQDAIKTDDLYKPSSAYEAYQQGIIDLGLGESSLFQAWMTESSRCLSEPTFVKLPYEETCFFDDLRPRSFAYRMKSRRGQKIDIQLTSQLDTQANVFIDLFHVISDSTHTYDHVATADSTWRLIFEPLVDGEFILRLQPELLKTGRYNLRISEEPVFAFPMAGRTETAILSLFGVERDAGRRIHEGNDIFAGRHRPIVAATSGTVTSTGDKGLGGKQIYIKDHKRNLDVYFAHLESILVQEGDQVIKGDTIATNGNSGNAQTTNPHLHFGIYSDTGAIDPYHYIVPNRRAHRPIRSDVDWTGQIVRTKNKAYFDHISNRYRNRRDSVPIHTIMYVDAAWSRSYRVRLPDGREGYVRSGDLTLADAPYRKRKASESTMILRSPQDTISIGLLEPDQTYDVMGRFSDYEYVDNGDSRGWIVK